MSTAAPARAVAAWCLYDWANSAFPTIVQTFLFSSYFTLQVAPDEAAGQAWWGWANAAVGVAIAVLGPLLGAIADKGGRRKPWLFAMTLLCVAATASLWFVRPDPRDMLLALALVGLAGVGFELAATFYNAMLPDLVGHDRLGRVSGWGWGLGYAGGLACLLLSVVLFVRPDPPPFGLERASAEHVRIVMPAAALWFALFVWPLFLWTLDRASSGLPLAAAVRSGLAELMATLREIRRHANVARFLLAKMIYIDGLNTLFAFGGIYAAGRFGLSLEEVLWFGVFLNVTAGFGAAVFAWVDDWLGAKPTIIISLVALSVLGTIVLFVDDYAWFYALALVLGLFLGPTQAASRSLMARLAPLEKRTEFFGLYALAGRITAPVGPLVLGTATAVFASQRAGMLTILPFFLLGLLLLLTVREPRVAQSTLGARPERSS
jgi:UMF1 family MFS transporter